MSELSRFGCYHVPYGRFGAMIPAGYMLKNVRARPSWIKADNVIDIFSVSPCISKDFADYIDYWRHNGFWLFNSPSVIEEIVVQEGINPADLRLFYYEVYEQQLDDDAMRWSSFDPEPSFTTNVEKPANAHLEGFDVVSFSSGTSQECSPLSCNALAEELSVNAHCLFETFEEAKDALEAGKFNNSEPGPFRIFSVYSVWRLNPNSVDDLANRTNH